MDAPRPIESVLRAFAVVKAMNLRPISSLADLHRETGLPKATLIRLLQTLEHAGLAGKGPRYGTYELRSGLVSLVSGYHSSPMIVEAAAQVAEKITREIKWPVAVAVPDGGAMVVRYSTIPRSSLSLLHSSIGMRLSLVTRALGRAYLAYCSDEERQALLDLVASGGGEGADHARDAKMIDKIVSETRARGYAIRDPLVRPVSSTLAVPIFMDSTVTASIGFTWFRSTYDIEKAVERYLTTMREAAKDISRRLSELAAARAEIG
ncbi:DNA-binding transcriptional regulator [Sphingosinicella terrae]|uniref:DNA-binding transcriptional regulator n=1 Tax=Sphingosinicella terrae TaxID=2172047 RepID=UPI000E0CC42D|nr:DNA-binding transcriptional regulator [Sphingosinicella terrae]